jgi:hypothetical protein
VQKQSFYRYGVLHRPELEGYRRSRLIAQKYIAEQKERMARRRADFEADVRREDRPERLNRSAAEFEAWVKAELSAFDILLEKADDNLPERVVAEFSAPYPYWGTDGAIIHLRSDQFEPFALARTRVASMEDVTGVPADRMSRTVFMIEYDRSDFAQRSGPHRSG